MVERVELQLGLSAVRRARRIGRSSVEEPRLLLLRMVVVMWLLLLMRLLCVRLLRLTRWGSAGSGGRRIGCGRRIPAAAAALLRVGRLRRRRRAGRHGRARRAGRREAILQLRGRGGRCGRYDGRGGQGRHYWCDGHRQRGTGSGGQDHGHRQGDGGRRDHAEVAGRQGAGHTGRGQAVKPTQLRLGLDPGVDGLTLQWMGKQNKQNVSNLFFRFTFPLISPVRHVPRFKVHTASLPCKVLNGLYQRFETTEPKRDGDRVPLFIEPSFTVGSV